MADTGSILVTGAAGQLGAVGRTVTGLLLERGLPVRAVGRTQARKPFVGPAGRPLWPAAPTSAWRAVSQQWPNFRIVSQLGLAVRCFRFCASQSLLPRCRWRACRSILEWAGGV